MSVSFVRFRAPLHAGVGAALAHKITNIYSWSIDFFKVKREIALMSLYGTVHK
jgi:hypothetical protein